MISFPKIFAAIAKSQSVLPWSCDKNKGRCPLEGERPLFPSIPHLNINIAVPARSADPEEGGAIGKMGKETEILRGTIEKYNIYLEVEMLERG